MSRWPPAVARPAVAAFGGAAAVAMPGVRLRVVASQAPRPELLRDQGCDLVVTPRPPEAADTVQKRLFEDRYAVFFDPAVRRAPDARAPTWGAAHQRALTKTAAASTSTAGWPAAACNARVGHRAGLRRHRRAAARQPAACHRPCGCWSAACCASSPARRCRWPRRRCRCTWSGTCAASTTRRTAGCARRWRPSPAKHWPERSLHLRLTAALASCPPCACCWPVCLP